MIKRLVLALLFPTAVLAQEIKFAPPAGPIHLAPDQVPYLELNQQGYRYLNKEWSEGYFQAILIDTAGERYTGQLFYLTDTSVVLYTTKIMFVPEIFESHHMEMDVRALERVRVRWRQSFSLGMQEGALFATGMGALGTVVMLFNPSTVAIAPFGLLFGMAAAIPTGFQWGLVRYIVPIYRNFPIQSDVERYQEQMARLKKYTLFPYYWPPSVTEKLLETTPLSAGMLHRPTDDMFPLRISEVSTGLSPLMFQVFRETVGNSGVTLGLQFDQLNRQMYNFLQQEGFRVLDDIQNRGTVGFDSEITVAPHWQAGLGGSLSFMREISATTDDQSETISVRGRRGNIQLGVDYLPVQQSRLMNRRTTWGAGAGLAGHAITWNWIWSLNDPNSGQTYTQNPDQREIQLGAFAHLWAELYLSKDTSVRAWAKYHAALPFRFDNLTFQAASNNSRALPAYINTLLYFEMGLSMRWHW